MTPQEWDYIAWVLDQEPYASHGDMPGLVSEHCVDTLWIVLEDSWLS